MFTKFTPIITAIFLLIALAGCKDIDSSSDSNDDTQGNESETYTSTNTADNYQMLPLISGKAASIELDESVDNTTQQLNVGEVMAISLESNITTGYSWSITIADPKVLALMGEPQYQEPPTDSGTPSLGAAGKQLFFLQAVGPGTTIVSLEYEQNSEQNVEADKMINFTVEVK